MPASAAILPTNDTLPPRGPSPEEATRVPVVLSFDVEEHFLIEAAAGLDVGGDLQAHYRERLEVTTRWLLDCLAARGVRATFFVVGQVARHNPFLVRDIHRAGHEVASHGWDHSRLHRLTPAEFRADLRRSKDALEQVTGAAVVGFRAPTFSVVPETAWAIDVLAEEGFLYDSSIYPIRHDRYGVPRAPRTPFLARGHQHDILELPPLTWGFLGLRVPVGGGGYFRLLPTWLLHRGIGQMQRLDRPALAMLYFHPWEFDSEQARLPLGRLNRFRTYVGIRRSKERLASLLRRHPFVRALDATAGLRRQVGSLESFRLDGKQCRRTASGLESEKSRKSAE
jgi:polysaccharide deacetylase family protein (PEP-CTERM system associated)